jgi:chromosome segregation ATPase
MEDRLAHQQDKAREAKGELEEIEALYEEGAMGEEAYREDRRRLRRHKKEAESKVSEIEREIDEVEFYLTETGEVS